MITELTVLFLAISQPTMQYEKVDAVTQTETMVSSVISTAIIGETPNRPLIKSRNCRCNQYKYLSQRHSHIATLRSGNRKINYWKRIRSRTWKKKSTSPLEGLTIILIVANFI